MFESLHALELEPLLHLQQMAGLTGPMKALSYLGPSAFLLALVGLVYLCFDARLGARLLALYFASEVITHFMKLVFHSPRPFWIDPRVQAFEPEATSYGFPSGHALVATCVWFFFASTARKPWVWITSVIAVLLVSISRVYLGTHFISDVAGGCLLGSVVLTIFLLSQRRVADWLKQLSFRRQILLCVSITVGIVFCGWFLRAMTADSAEALRWTKYTSAARSFRSLGSYAGTILGLGIGFAMAARAARFAAGGSIRQRILRIVLIAIPATGYWLRPKGLLANLPDLVSFSLLFVACAFAAWAFTFVVPWLFLKIKLAEPLASADSLASSAEPKHEPNLP